MGVTRKRWGLLLFAMTVAIGLLPLQLGSVGPEPVAAAESRGDADGCLRHAVRQDA